MDPSSAFSSVSTLAEKFNLDNAKNLVSSGVDKLSGAVQGLTKRGPTNISLQLESQIPKGLPRIPASPEIPTTRVVRKKIQGELLYPADIKYFIKFSFFKYERVIATQKPTEIARVNIILPMPSNLAEAFSSEYDEPALGALTGAASDAIFDKIRQMQGAGPAFSRGGSFDLINSAAAALYNKSLTGLNSSAKGGVVSSELVRRATGLTPNPYLALVFKNVKLRTHQFSFRFAPNSQKELDVVKNIIKQFKISMLPGVLHGSSDMAFTFPDTCNISFGPNKELPYKFKKSMLTDVSVNYSPNGPAFFKTGDPVIVEISLTFKEMEPYLRRDEGEGDTRDAEAEEEVKKQQTFSKAANDANRIGPPDMRDVVDRPASSYLPGRAGK